LVVIGVHTPEFTFEHELERVREATKEREIDWRRRAASPVTFNGVDAIRSD
jgi:hypothetical protein